MTTSPETGSEQELTRADVAGLHVLRNVCIDDVWGLLACCSVRVLEPGEVLIEAGQDNDTMYMVLSGSLSVHLDHPRAEPVAHVDTGQTVGELSVIDGSRATAYVRAASVVRLLAVDEQTFWRLVMASHDFAANLLVLLARRMRANNASLSTAEKLRKQLEREATMDGLTGLYNRRWLEERLPRLVARFQRSLEPLSVVMIDIDHFKQVNDRFGHVAGDQVLRAVAQAIQRDVRPTDLAARYGGEEMVVLLPDTGLEGARCAAERLRAKVSSLHIEASEGVPLPTVTISLGISTLEAGDSAQSIVDRADAALYRAKREGRNRVVTQ